MPYIDVEGSIPESISTFDSYQVYNALDCCITAQLLPVMMDQLNQNTAATYRRGMNVLALCLEMSSKGFCIDRLTLANLIFDLQKASRRALALLHRYCDAVGFRPVNPRSPIDVPELFYTHLKLPEIFEFDRKTNKRKLSADIKALEKLRSQYPVARPFVNAIIAFREAAKMESVFSRGLEPATGNLRCNFTPTGTETGRLSSQQNPYGRGTNGQNLTDRVRQTIVAPDGWAILNFDLKTAESVAVGYLSGDRAYISACESGDLHTGVCKLVWPHLSWTGDRKSDKSVAESPFYRHFTYRDQAKRGGHGSNYYGKPRTIAQIINVPTKVMEEFQAQYFAAFPGIQAWHLETIAKVQREGIITTPLRRERRFWGRPDDEATWREAIAYAPQSLVGDVMNEGLIQVLRWLQTNEGSIYRKNIDLRAQVHDAGVFLVPISELHELVPIITRLLQRPVDFGPLGTMLIENDAMIGKSWNKAPKPGKSQDPFLLRGLRDYDPSDDLEWLKAA